jgi:oxygen-dependent protoporphyrinogen oxidase
MKITIVGGGISGLSLAYFILKNRPDTKITIFEAAERPGGKIFTDRQKGFLCEAAVNGFLNNRPLTLTFIKELQLQPLRSSDAARRRFVYFNGKLHQLPENLQSFLLSGLLSPCGKGRLLYEIIIPKGDRDDESLASFAIRRLGREAYEKLIEPMAIGIYAGDAERLSLKSCFPRIYELEKRYGSLIKALIKLQREAKKTGKPVGPSPSGILTSFYNGMETVITKLREILSDKLVLSTRVEEVHKIDKGYKVFTSDGKELNSDLVILACPAYEASRILKKMSTELSSILSEIPYPAVSVVCIGFRYEDIEASLNGFGFLVPSKERRRILGTLWDSSIFPNRAPEGYVLLRSMVGGARSPELAMKDDEELISLVLDELREIMGIDAPVEFSKVYRHERAIPQYILGHPERLQRIDEILKDFKGLYLTGNAYRGIGFNDCIQNSYELAERITH